MEKKEKLKYSENLKVEAKNMFFAGYNCNEIAKVLDIEVNNVYYWRDSQKWAEASVATQTQSCVHYRYNLLILKEDKSPKDYNEIEFLAKQLERTARLQTYEKTQNLSDLNDKVKARSQKVAKAHKERASARKISDEQVPILKEAIKEALYKHQETWLANSNQSIRFILKSRQIGATYYFALEALLTALETGKNQIFISSSKNQARVFRSNIIAFVAKVLDIELKGENLRLSPDCTMYFLGTNSRTAQSYSGDVYLDEVFWIQKFTDIYEVASGMATQDDRRITLFSTPSTSGHEAVNIWNGEHANEGKTKKDKIKIDVSHKALKDGLLCADGIWRQIVTVEDAINKGFDLITLDKLKLKYPNKKQYQNLFLCEFIDDFNSLFKFSDLQKAMVDIGTEWKDFKPYNPKPFNKPVWLGFDPSRSRDNASLAIIAPPSPEYPYFRLLAHETYNGLDFEEQARKIKEICQKYDVQFLGIDSTGIGKAVHDLVLKFYPTAKEIIYSLETKNNMVFKALHCFQNEKFKFSNNSPEIASAFLTIHQAPTRSGSTITYKSIRDGKNHGDIAWAILNALDNSSIDSLISGDLKPQKNTILIC